VKDGVVIRDVSEYIVRDVPVKGVATNAKGGCVHQGHAHV